MGKPNRNFMMVAAILIIVGFLIGVFLCWLTFSHLGNN